MKITPRRVLSLGLGLALLAGTAAMADDTPELPLLHGPVFAGKGKTTAAPSVAPSAHVSDGDITDWVGEPTRFGGQARYSRGEYVYTDHLFDAYGADDGRDANRPTVKLGEDHPDTYRLDGLSTTVPDELGFSDSLPYELQGNDRWGNLKRVDAADISEVRVAADGSDVHLLTRLTTMVAPEAAAVLVLVDRDPGGKTQPVPFGAGLSTKAEIAVLLASSGSRAIDLASGVETPVTAVFNADGYTNAIEASLPRALFARKAGKSSVVVATGPFDVAKGTFTDMRSEDAKADLPNIANVAFRGKEPVQVWFDKEQALALHAGSIDTFATDIDLDGLASGRTEGWRPGPGYFDRIFVSDASFSGEGSTEGILQHYGIYVPSAYKEGTPAPATFWLHWRGGKAHSAASVAPRIMRDLGEARGGFVFAPRGRGTSTWYLGKGMADFLEVWNDSMSSFTVDANRVYVSGHSMGGWGSYLMSTVFPDRFAAGLPVAPPATQGAYVSPVDDKCDQCFIQANNGDAKASHVYKLLDNVRHVPLAIFQGAADELVPLPQNVGMAKRLTELGYRHRFYVFPGYEHYSHPIIDEWADGARYMGSFIRNPNPREVTYVRDMPFERAAETGPDQRPANQTKGLSFDFDRAYWMSELTPRDMVAGRARFTGTTAGRPEQQVLTVPDAGGPTSLGQSGPYAYTGLQQVVVPGAPLQPPANSFTATLTGASAVRLDVARMGLRIDAPLTGVVTTDGAFELRLAGPWATVPTVTVGGIPVVATLADGVLRIPVVAAGANNVAIR